MLSKLRGACIDAELFVINLYIQSRRCQWTSPQYIFTSSLLNIQQCTSHFTYLILQHIFLTTFPHISIWQGFLFFLRQTWTLSFRTLLLWFLFRYFQCTDPWTNPLNFRWAPQLVLWKTKIICSFELKAFSIFQSIYTDNDSPLFAGQSSQISFFWPPCEPFLCSVHPLLQNHPLIPPVWF